MMPRLPPVSWSLSEGLVVPMPMVKKIDSAKLQAPYDKIDGDFSVLGYYFLKCTCRHGDCLSV